MANGEKRANCSVSITYITIFRSQDMFLWIDLF